MDEAMWFAEDKKILYSIFMYKLGKSFSARLVQFRQKGAQPLWVNI